MISIATIGIACNSSAVGGWPGKEINKLPGIVKQTIVPITSPVDAANDLVHGKAPSMGETASIAKYQPVPIGGDWFIRIEVGDGAGNSDVRYVIA